MIDRDTRLGGPTPSGTEAVTDPNVTLSVAVPWLTPSARPVPLTLATVLAEEDHVTRLVTFCVVPSL